MIQSVFLWAGGMRYSHTVPVDDLYQLRNLKSVVVDCLVVKEYLEALQLMHGEVINIMTLWDWADLIWDRLNDRRLNTDLSNEMFMVASNRTDLCEVFSKHSQIERIQHMALDYYERRNDPPNYFTKSSREFFI